MRWRPAARPRLSSLRCHGLDTGIEAREMTVPGPFCLPRPRIGVRETPWRSHARRAARCRTACRRRGGAAPGVRGRRSARRRTWRNSLRQQRPARRQATASSRVRPRARCAAWPTRQRGRSGAACSGRSGAGGARRLACNPHGMAFCGNAMPVAIIHALLDHGTAKIAYPSGLQPCSLPSPSPSQGEGRDGGEAVDVLTALRHGCAAPGVARRQVTFFCFAKRCRVQ